MFDKSSQNHQHGIMNGTQLILTYSPTQCKCQFVKTNDLSIANAITYQTTNHDVDAQRWNWKRWWWQHLIYKAWWMNQCCCQRDDVHTIPLENNRINVRQELQFLLGCTSLKEIKSFKKIHVNNVSIINNHHHSLNCYATRPIRHLADNLSRIHHNQGFSFSSREFY